MADRLRLGIDVGGTNTDAALMAGREVVATTKKFTTEDVRDGVIEAVAALVDGTDARGRIDAVMIGTTQFVNAFVQRRDLMPVAAIRIALPMGDGVPPFAGWPSDALEAVKGSARMTEGGAYFNGRDYRALDAEGVRRAARDAAAQGITCFAVSATFSPIRPDIEAKARAIILDAVPGALVTLSSDIGGVGLLDRENAAIINASLGPLARRVVASLERAVADLAIDAPVFISQNDGTLIDTEVAAHLPILTCSAGPTNSFRGAAFLTGLADAIVADIGGTTTDVGFLAGGFARETTAPNRIGGVRTNLRMPDVLSIGMGGGSLVWRDEGRWRVGPHSVGFRLQSEGRIFGGSTLTATDVAVRAGQAAIGDRARVADLAEADVGAMLDDIHAQVEDAIDQVKVNAAPLPLIVVGGGSVLLSRALRGTSDVIRPRHAEVANAVGAAIAMVSGRVNRLFDVGRLGREAALAEARQEAIAAAIAAGAEPEQVEVIDLQELPMTHMRMGAVQIRARAVGPLSADAMPARTATA
jgi:N-methylhydantoinase A/oxoprolinase/acetone carboxylase beta subunit